jgi:hypothetical protein
VARASASACRCHTGPRRRPHSPPAPPPRLLQPSRRRPRRRGAPDTAAARARHVASTTLRRCPRRLVTSVARARKVTVRCRALRPPLLLHAEQSPHWSSSRRHSRPTAAAHAAEPPTGVVGEIFPPRTALSRLQIAPGLLVVPHLAIEPPQPFLAPPPPPIAPPPLTSAATHSQLRSRLHKQSQPKVSMWLRSPRSPLHFPLPPAAADPWGAAARRRLRSPLSPSPVLNRGKKKGVLPLPPALSPFPTEPPPLYSLSLSFFQIRPYPLNYTTKTTLSLYN